MHASFPESGTLPARQAIEREMLAWCLSQENGTQFCPTCLGSMFWQRIKSLQIQQIIMDMTTNTLAFTHVIKGEMPVLPWHSP